MWTNWILEIYLISSLFFNLLTSLHEVKEYLIYLLQIFLTVAYYYYSLVGSDHDKVIVYPRDVTETNRTTTYFRDVRDHNKLIMLHELGTCDWNTITMNVSTPDEMVQRFYEMILPSFEKCFPLINVRSSTHCHHS